MKTKVVIFALGILALVGGMYGYFHEGIQRGLSFPGQVGTAADHYFHDGTKLNPAFDYFEVTLADGTVWKTVQANTGGQTSYPSWLIVLWQGPNRETYVLESSHDDHTRSKLLSMDTLNLKAETWNSSDLIESLRQRGFRKTSY